MSKYIVLVRYIFGNGAISKPMGFVEARTVAKDLMKENTLIDSCEICEVIPDETFVTSYQFIEGHKNPAAKLHPPDVKTMPSTFHNLLNHLREQQK